MTLFFIGPGMIDTLCGHAERTLNIWIVAVISTFLTGGAVCAIDQVTGREAFSNIIISFVIGIGFWNIMYSNAKQNRNYYTVTVISQNNSIEVKGLYDSGNVLCAGRNREPVHIASDKVFSILTEKKDSIMVPYKSLGNEDGIIEVYRFDCMQIKCGYSRIELHDVLIGKASASLLKNVAYDIILNEAVFSDTKGMEDISGKG